MAAGARRTAALVARREGGMGAVHAVVLKSRNGRNTARLRLRLRRLTLVRSRKAVAGAEGVAPAVAGAAPTP